MYIRKGYEETKGSNTERENRIRLKVLVVYSTAVSSEDMCQLFDMERRFRWACCNFGCCHDPRRYERACESHEKEYVLRKAWILVKKLLWLNSQCYKLVRYEFIRCRLDMSSEMDIFMLAYDFSRCLRDAMCE